MWHYHHGLIVIDAYVVSLHHLFSLYMSTLQENPENAPQLSPHHPFQFQWVYHDYILTMGNPSGLPSSSLLVNVGILPSYSHKVVASPPPTFSFPSAYIISFSKSGYPTIIFSKWGSTPTSHPPQAPPHHPTSTLPVWIRIPSLHAHQWTPIQLACSISYSNDR